MNESGSFDTLVEVLFERWLPIENLSSAFPLDISLRDASFGNEYGLIGRSWLLAISAHLPLLSIVPRTVPLQFFYFV